MQKTHRNIQCVVTLLPSVQLWLKLDSYCSCITKLPVHTARMSRGMDMGYHFFYYRCDQGLLSAPLNYKGMDTCPGIATQCLLSGGILHTQGWHTQNVSGNCCEKHLRVIPSGNSLSNVLFTVMKGVCSRYHLPLTWEEKKGPAADKLSIFCTVFVQRTLSWLLKGLRLRILQQFYFCFTHCILLEKIL